MEILPQQKQYLTQWEKATKRIDSGPNHGCTTIHEDTCADNLGFSDGISDTGRTGSLKLSSQTDPSCPFIHTAVQCWFAHECQTDRSAIAPPSPW